MEATAIQSGENEGSHSLGAVIFISRNDDLDYSLRLPETNQSEVTRYVSTP